MSARELARLRRQVQIQTDGWLWSTLENFMSDMASGEYLMEAPHEQRRKARFAYQVCLELHMRGIQLTLPIR